jgi:hypothetical protein
MLEAHLESGQIVSCDGRVLEIFDPPASSRRFHVTQLSPPSVSQHDRGHVLIVGDGLVFTEQELPLARRLCAAISSALEAPL